MSSSSSSLLSYLPPLLLNPSTSFSSSSSLLLYLLLTPAPPNSCSSQLLFTSSPLLPFLLITLLPLPSLQINEEDASLVEIGPRFVLNPIKIFAGSFSGKVLWSNPHFVTPNFRRRLKRMAGSAKYINRIGKKASLEDRKPVDAYKMDPTDAIFDAKPAE